MYWLQCPNPAWRGSSKGREKPHQKKSSQFLRWLPPLLCRPRRPDIRPQIPMNPGSRKDETLPFAQIPLTLYNSKCFCRLPRQTFVLLSIGTGHRENAKAHTQELRMAHPQGAHRQTTCRRRMADRFRKAVRPGKTPPCIRSVRHRRGPAS